VATFSYIEVYNGDNLSGADGSYYGFGNSFNLHYAHMNEAASLSNASIVVSCLTCHSRTRLEQQNYHFTNLVTGGNSLTKLAAKGTAVATVGDAAGASDTKITSYSYNQVSSPRGSCTPKDPNGCHGTRNWFKQ
jgi:hypothetical protein